MIRRRRELLGEGTVRGAAPGTTFELTDHARHAGTDAEQRRFLITAVTHRARNNLATLLPISASATAPDAGTADFYRNRIHCVPAAVPWRPL
ncbi:type VI secretion system secreted protein VgrG, partial [Aromatoleum tolulyticum]